MHARVLFFVSIAVSTAFAADGFRSECNLHLRRLGLPGAWEQVRDGEVVTVSSKSGRLYTGVYRGEREENGEPMLRLEISGRVYKLAKSKLTADPPRKGAAVPELYDLHPDEPVELTSASGTKRTGYVEGFNEHGDILFRTTEKVLPDGRVEKFPEPGRADTLNPANFDFAKYPPFRLVPDVYDSAAQETRVLRPRERLEGYPHAPHSKAWKEAGLHGPIEKAIGKPADAVPVADRLMRDLDNILIDLREAMARLDFSDPKNFPEVDKILTKLFERMHHPDLLKGTGYRNATLDGKNKLKAKLVGWAKTDREVANATHEMRAYAGVDEGYVWPFVFDQTVSGRPAPRMTAEDKNNRKLYVEQLLIDAEEHYHVVQLLRHYSGAKGPELNISNWARKSGVDFEINAEADVFAAISERVGNLGEFWRDRYSARRHVPRDLPLAPRPR